MKNFSMWALRFQGLNIDVDTIDSSTQYGSIENTGHPDRVPNWGTYLSGCKNYKPDYILIFSLLEELRSPNLESR